MDIVRCGDCATIRCDGEESICKRRRSLWQVDAALDNDRTSGSASPSGIQGTGRAERLEGEIPSPANPPSGCTFHTRCPMARDRCRAEVPDLRVMVEGHRAACHFSEELAAPGARVPATEKVPG